MLFSQLAMRNTFAAVAVASSCRCALPGFKSDGDTSSPCGCGKEFQCPMSFLLLISGIKVAASTSHQLPGRIGGH
jgi:hypothetical protein